MILEQIAEEMVLAATTAPKARGLDKLVALVAKADLIQKLSDKMKEIGQRENHQTFLRDADSISQAAVVVLLGAKKHYLGLKYCGFCGFVDCAACEKNKAQCAFVPGDLGIAIGSAVSIAMDHRADSRVMYSVGKAALELGLLPEAALAIGIPLSGTGKNPFFDRK
jgi:uncharacterized ferredoxin-like protein